MVFSIKLCLLYELLLTKQGFAIGNGLTDPAIQYKAYTDYALDMGIIKESQYKLINLIVPVCEAAIKLCGTDGTVSCMAAYLACNTIFISITLIAGNINVRKYGSLFLFTKYQNVLKTEPRITN